MGYMLCGYIGGKRSGLRLLSSGVLGGVNRAAEPCDKADKTDKQPRQPIGTSLRASEPPLVQSSLVRNSCRMSAPYSHSINSHCFLRYGLLVIICVIQVSKTAMQKDADIL